MKHKETESTNLEERLYNNLAQALIWLENVAEVIGDTSLVDSCPNGWGGRVVIIEALKDAEAMHPELSNFPPGTYIVTDDGFLRGFVTGHGMLKQGGGELPCYRVDIGGGRETVVPCQSARRA